MADPPRMEERYKEQLRRLNTSIYRVIQTREWILLDIDIYMNILYQLHKLQCLGEFSLNLAKKTSLYDCNFQVSYYSTMHL